MSNMRRYITILAAALAVGCANENISTPEPDTTPTVVVPEGATAGEVIIKFAPEMEAILDQTMTRSGGVATRSGIPSTDEVLDILGAHATRSVHARRDYTYGISCASTRMRTFSRPSSVYHSWVRWISCSATAP